MPTGAAQEEGRKMQKQMKEYKILVWINVQTYDERDGFGDYSNWKLIPCCSVGGYSEQDVRAKFCDGDLYFGNKYELQEVK